MTIDTATPGPLRTGVKSAALVLTAILAAAPALAQQVEGQVNKQRAVVPKEYGRNMIVHITGRDTNAGAITQFDFHPSENHATPIAKNVPNARVTPRSITHDYVGTEQHGTTGEATHSLSIQRNANIRGKVGDATVDSVTARETRGQNENQFVSIDGRLYDPFSFSDTDMGATYGLVQGGLEEYLTLQAGTHFPTQFSHGPGQPGAFADGCGIALRARVAPGVIENYDPFWLSTPTGAIDLYTLTLHVDETGAVSADLQFGQPNSFFSLSYVDQNGNPFDPASPGAVAGLEQLIAGAFVDGAMTTDLSNIFGVGFEPTSLAPEFSLGGESSVRITAAVPSPGAAILLALAAPLATRRHRGPQRRQSGKEHKRPPLRA